MNSYNIQQEIIKLLKAGKREQALLLMKAAGYIA